MTRPQDSRPAIRSQASSPPNKKSPEGEGNVFFTVMPKPDLQTGAEIRNGARIFFDVNEPIDTPVWLNTIDNSRPASQVTALAATQTAVRFEVRWSGTDTGAGVSHYDIYVSENDGPFVVWLENTTATAAFYGGRINTRYRFYSVAADGADNLEAAPANADASTVTPNISVQFGAAAFSFNESEAANGAAQRDAHRRHGGHDHHQLRHR